MRSHEINDNAAPIMAGDFPDGSFFFRGSLRHKQFSDRNTTDLKILCNAVVRLNDDSDGIYLPTGSLHHSRTRSSPAGKHVTCHPCTTTVLAFENLFLCLGIVECLHHVLLFQSCVVDIIEDPVTSFPNNGGPIMVRDILPRKFPCLCLLKSPLPDAMECHPEADRVGQGKRLEKVTKRCDGKTASTNGVGISPIFYLIGATNFAIAVQSMHSPVARNMNLVRMARKNDSDTLANVVSILAHCALANSNAFVDSESVSLHG